LVGILQAWLEIVDFDLWSWTWNVCYLGLKWKLDLQAWFEVEMGNLQAWFEMEIDLQAPLIWSGNANSHQNSLHFLKTWWFQWP
jgi:hypothetical protein